MEIAAGEFKAKCLRLMDEVAQTRESVIITKHGKPIAKLVPVDAAPASPFGFLQGSVRFTGNVTAPTGSIWDADV